MTPTEQDNELGAQLDKIFPCDCSFIKGFAFKPGDPCDGSCVTAPYRKAVLELITADRKRVALEAFDEGYEAGRKEKPPKLVDAVEFRRESYGWSKGKMAAMLDMTKGHYSEFIHEKRGLPVNSIRKAYAIGVPAQVLLQDDIDRRLEAQQEEV